MSHLDGSDSVGPIGRGLLAILLLLPLACSSNGDKPRLIADGATPDQPNAGAGGAPRADGPAVTGGAAAASEAGAGGAPGSGGRAMIDAVSAPDGAASTGGDTATDGASATGDVVGGGAAGGGDVSISLGGATGGGDVDGDGTSATGGIDGGPGAGGGGQGGGPGGGGSGAGGTTVASVCGDLVVSGNENCDDGNAMPFDGCGADCRKEPTCGASGPCTSVCGDGLVIGEECDDGNTTDGDGCSATCSVEPGWTCAQPPLADQLLMPAVFRDFRYHSPTDFESGTTGSSTAAIGIVKTDLDADGKPVYSGLSSSAIHVESATTFGTWYRNSDGVNHATIGSLALWSNGDGTYANRFGANGERWKVTTTAYFCGTVGYEINGQPCTYRIPLDGGTTSYPVTDCQTLEDKGYSQLKCTSDAGTYQASYVVAEVDGNPLFFPVDRDAFTPTSERQGAQIPSQPQNLYDATGAWPWDLDDAGNKRLHNFSFTSEMRFWLKYDASKKVRISVTGDDDVWVFIHGKLALDVGGIHQPVAASLTLDSAAATKLGLDNGGVYEIAIFQAERQTTSSTLAVAMPGFNTAASVCRQQ